LQATKGDGLPHSIRLHQIATELRDPQQILDRIRAASQRPAPAGRLWSRAPPTPLEREVAELWAGLLNLQAAGHPTTTSSSWAGIRCWPCSCFRACGIWYGVELSLEVVYSGEFTGRSWPKRWKLKEIELAGGNYRDC